MPLERSVAGVAGVARGERGERGPGYQERLTDSREAIYLERVELATLTYTNSHCWPGTSLCMILGEK